MVFNPSIAMTWILFLALFPISFVWLRRAYRIFIKKNYSEVAQKKGVAPKNPQKWAPVVGLLNLVAGAVCVYTIYTVLMGLAPYDDWSAMAGTTIWTKLFADFIIRQQAHPFQFGKKKKQEEKKTCTA
ncbi:hypothetical protein SAMN02745165_01140 [Malonomonas rubra DSM 5091]|uniref:SdpI/YhfL protein family protein n=1 Tax=Malonomonas rubra DSM 5091 TaxID=1122189 RepID=A0A1M6F362_MALRU|nr:hypothetical protein [Malonomonas rubra]SHI92137.1 hypothetical protein SAMN02745165_01140 [Malonomonas rubra DSM 5091]